MGLNERYPGYGLTLWVFGTHLVFGSYCLNDSTPVWRIESDIHAEQARTVYPSIAKVVIGQWGDSGHDPGVVFGTIGRTKGILSIPWGTLYRAFAPKCL